MKNKEGLIFNISEKEVKANRPEAIVSKIDVVPYNSQMNPDIAVEALADGYHVLITDYYSSGLNVLKALKTFVKSQYPDGSFQGQRDFRDAFRKLSQRLLIVVRNNELVVKKAPEIGWLKILFPELKEFLLPFTQVQGLNSSWQWYTKGFFIPVLNKKINPWYGTYFPTRFDHLKLFNTWLKHFKGSKESAIDVGIGSGVLTFQILKQGFEKVYGTDLNPNAIIGLDQYLKGRNEEPKIELFHGDLFADCNTKSELIVFNPPWLPASHNTQGLDTAVYYEADLFTRFFRDAEKFLLPGGKIVLLFSNLAQVTNLTDFHPIKRELEEGGRYRKTFFAQREVKAASVKTKRDQNWRASEIVELWELSRML